MSTLTKAEKATGRPVYYIGGSIWVAVNLAEASSPATFAATKEEAEAGEFHTTPYQSASFSCNPRKIGPVLREWLKSRGY